MKAIKQTGFMLKRFNRLSSLGSYADAQFGSLIDAWRTANMPINTYHCAMERFMGQLGEGTLAKGHLWEKYQVPTNNFMP